jgi:hypothetical protein
MTTSALVRIGEQLQWRLSETDLELRMDSGSFLIATLAPMSLEVHRKVEINQDPVSV